MLLSQITVPWKLLNNPDGTGAASGEWRMGGRTAALNFEVAWSALESFCQQIAGVPTAYGVGLGAKVVQQVPLVYPFNPKLYAQRIAYRAAAMDPGVTVARPFGTAMVTVEFGSFPFDPGTGSTPWLDIKVKGSINFVTLPGVAFSFSGNGERIEQDVGRIVGQLAFSVTRLQIPDFDLWMATIVPLGGCVNSVPLTISRTALAAGTVLFPTLDLDESTTVLGSPQSQSTIELLWRSVPGNQAMRADGTIDSLVPAPYPTADLSPLLN